MQRLSRAIILLSLGALVLLAEDFWTKKPYTDWSAKDAAKILSNSPWTHEVSVSLGSSSPMASPTGRGSRGGGGQGMGGSSDTIGMGGAGESSTTPVMGDGGAGSGRGRGRGDTAMGENTAGSMIVRVCWQSAPAVRQALVITKLGREKVDSDEAKKFLSQALPGYIIEVMDLPPTMARIPQERLNEIAKSNSSLRIKDKDPIAAVALQAVSRDKFVDLYFVFPKDSAISLEDKEVEFVSSVGRFEVRKKFKLKDMVVGDKLEL